MLAFAPALAWCAAIFVASSFPGTAYPDLGFRAADKLVHVIIYGVLGFACALGLFRGLGWRRASVLVVSVLLATAYGLTDEFHQIFVPHRSADWADIVADAIGAFVGATVFITPPVSALLGGRRKERDEAGGDEAGEVRAD